MTLKQKGEINTDTIIVGDFNTLLSTMERSSKRRINQETADLNNTTDHMDRIDTHTQNIPSASSTIYILLKLTWKLF